MPFKKNSPGCVCCARNIWARGSGGFDISNAYFTGEYTAEGFRYAVENGIDPNTVLIIGANIEDKYWLVYNKVTEDIQQFNPLTRLTLGTLWNSSSDIALEYTSILAADPGISSEFYYMPSWNVGYGIVTASSQGMPFSVDSSGNFLSGPHSISQDFHLDKITCMSNGDLYVLSGITTADPDSYRYLRVSVYPASGGFSIFDFDEPLDRFVGSGSTATRRYMEVNTIFCDGTQLYIYLYNGPDGAYDEGVYTLSTGGAIAYDSSLIEINLDFEDPESTASPKKGLYINTTIYTPSEERWQMAVTQGSFFGFWAWLDKDFIQGKYLRHAMGRETGPGTVRPHSHMLVIHPLDIEDYWDVL
jgi:hypothetical protein